MNNTDDKLSAWPPAPAENETGEHDSFFDRERTELKPSRATVVLLSLALALHKKTQIPLRGCVRLSKDYCVRRNIEHQTPSVWERRAQIAQLGLILAVFGVNCAIFAQAAGVFGDPHTNAERLIRVRRDDFYIFFLVVIVVLLTLVGTANIVLANRRRRAAILQEAEHAKKVLLPQPSK